MRKKAGILTIHHVNNYGAELQAYALQHSIEQLGYDTENINYLFYKHPRFKKTKRSKPFTDLSMLQKVKEWGYPYISYFKSLRYYDSKKVRDSRFESFHQTYSKFSEEYRSIDELYEAQHDYDMFIAGSDQIWNPNTNTNLEPYFLTFAPENKTKLSYASSFGVDTLPEKSRSVYQDYLRGFKKVSVREKSGVHIVKELLGIDVPWVLDPTFLFSASDYEKIALSPGTEKPYLLLYVLTDDEYITEKAIQIADHLDLNIVRICKIASKQDKTDRITNILDAGPREFLGWFLNASFVLTTSFHGACFSINFRKPFYSILKQEKLNNTRQISLLKALGLENRIKYVGDPINVNSLKINYLNVSGSLDKKISESKTYLKESLIECEETG